MKNECKYCEADLDEYGDENERGVLCTNCNHTQEDEEELDNTLEENNI